MVSIENLKTFCGDVAGYGVIAATIVVPCMPIIYQDQQDLRLSRQAGTLVPRFEQMATGVVSENSILRISSSEEKLTAVVSLVTGDNLTYKVQVVADQAFNRLHVPGNWTLPAVAEALSIGRPVEFPTMIDGHPCFDSNRVGTLPSSAFNFDLPRGGFEPPIPRL